MVRDHHLAGLTAEASIRTEKALTQLEVFPVDKLHRVGVVVKDLETAARNYAEIFGIDRWTVSTFDGKRLSDTTVDGRRVEHTFRSATGTTPSGALTFELIEAGDGLSSYKVSRMTRGFGVHDVVLRVTKPGEMDDVHAFFASRGIRCSQSGVIDGDTAYYEFDTRAVLRGYSVRVISSPDGNATVAGDEEWDLSTAYTRPDGISPLDVQKVGHLGVVVSDLMATVRDYAGFFGIPRWNFMNWRTEPERLMEPYYIGAAGTHRPVDHEYFTTMVPLKDFGFEIIQPTFGPSHYKEDFLNVVGEGVHHLFLLTYDDETRWDRHAAWLDSIGLPLCMGGDLMGGRVAFAYANGQSKVGFVVEAVIIREPFEPDPNRLDSDFSLELDDVAVPAGAPPSAPAG